MVRYKKSILGAVLLLLTFSVYYFSVGKMWFVEDDLGVIMKGLIRKPADIPRIFATDQRDYLTAENYRRTKPNVVSAIYRPLQNVFFSVVYAIAGLNVKAYYAMAVATHAINAMLFFFLLAMCIPVWLALIGGFLFAFYPENGMLTWISTYNNSQSIMFLLLCLIFYARYYQRKEQDPAAAEYGVLAASLSFYLLSLFSRENGMFMPFWLVGAVFLSSFTKLSFWQSFKKTFFRTMPIFIVLTLYVGARMGAFGVSTLDRTVRNFAYRFPVLTKWINVEPVKPVVAGKVNDKKPKTVREAVALQLSDSKPTHKPTLGNRLKNYMIAWSNCIFMKDMTNKKGIELLLMWLMVMALCLIAFYGNYVYLLILLLGVIVFSWQAVVAYPCARYLNISYPFFILIAVGGASLMLKRISARGRPVAAALFFLLFLYAGGQGIRRNSLTVNSSAAKMATFYEQYNEFFQKHSISPTANIIVLGSPFVADIQNIFQYFTGNLDMHVYHEPFATVAKKGVFGCQQPFMTERVRSSYTPIPGGFRFTSHDKHCAMWHWLSDFPVVWAKESRSYVWSSNFAQTNQWELCSLGKFNIHQRIDGRLITDISFVFDKEWLQGETVVVGWDSIKGNYTVLDSSHLSSEGNRF